MGAKSLHPYMKDETKEKNDLGKKTKTEPAIKAYSI